MDISWVFCNRCGSGDKSKFFLTSCHHIFCCECLHMIDHVCSVCDLANFTLDEIEPGLVQKNAKLAALFRKKDEILKKAVKMYDFQYTQTEMLIERLRNDNASLKETLAQEKAARKSLEAELATVRAASKEDEDEELKDLETPRPFRHRTETMAPGVSDVSFSSELTTSTSSGRSPYFEN